MARISPEFTGSKVPEAVVPDKQPVPVVVNEGPDKTPCKVAGAPEAKVVAPGCQ